MRRFAVIVCVAVVLFAMLIPVATFVAATMIALLIAPAAAIVLRETPAPSFESQFLRAATRFRGPPSFSV